jgi:hypothetical protein
MYLIVSGLPNLAELAYSYYSLPPGFGFEQNLQSQLIGRAIGGVIDVVAGILLVFGSKGLATFLARLQGSTRDESEDVDWGARGMTWAAQFRV